MRSIDGEVPAIHPPNQAFRPRNVSGAIFCVRIIARQVKGDSKMGKNEKTKKPKPKYNVWQNTAYMLSVAWDTRRSVPLLVVLLANAVLIQTDTYSALPLAELKSRDDIDLAVVGSSIVGEHLNANLVSEQTGLTAFSASVPSLSLQGEIALTREIYRKNSPAYTVLSLEPYNLNSAKEYTSAYYRLTPYLSSWRDKITYYLDACREDGLYLDRLFMFREFGVESLSDILKTVGLRLNPLKTYEKLKPTLDDTVTYEGSGFLRYDREPDVADLVREKLQREQQREPTVEQIARELGIRAIKELPLALDLYFLPEKRMPAKGMLALANLFGKRMRSLPEKNGLRFALSDRYKKNITNFVTRVLMIATGDDEALEAKAREKASAIKKSQKGKERETE